MQTLRTRPALVILLAILALLLLTGVVYAIGHSLGYIPGVGLVDASSLLRVLAEPVSVTRDGITVTVEEAVLSSDKTVIWFTVNNIPLDKLSQDLTECGAKSVGLKLSDGSFLQTVGGYGLNAWGSGYEDRFTFEPVPAGMNEATFILPCIQKSLPGTLPENWELPLRFTSAPPGMTVIPVIEVTPSQEASSGNPLAIKKIIETENGYILAGTFSSAGLPQGTRAVQFSQPPTITDASGQEIPFTFANYELDLPSEKKEKGIFPWAFEVQGKQFNWPLTLTVNSVAVEYSTAQVSFDFDAGPNPQEGQEWDLNLDINLAGFPVRVLKAFRTADGYSFNFESTTLFHGVNIVIGDSAQALTGMDDPTHFSSSVTFTDAVPSGKLTVLVTRPVVATSGNWLLQWQPENASIAPLPAPAEATQACLTVDSWQAALSNPAPIPAELNSRVIVTGPLVGNEKDSAENMGIFTVNLDGSDKHVLGQGVTHASASPDGSQIVYRSDDGLHIAEVASGTSHLIPNTITNDDSPLWSPDGTRIAFVRLDEFDLYLINPDGTNLQRVTHGIEQELLFNWLPDGSSLLYSVEVQGGFSIRKLELASSAVTDLFTANTGSEASISPDGSEIAFFDNINKTTSGLFISHLDGSDRRLVAQMGQMGVITPRWSPNGMWLSVSTGNTNSVWPTAALVNPQTCQIIPLPINGEIDSWVH